MELATEILQWVVFSIGCASIVVQLFDKIAGVTPSDKDDVIAGKIKRVLGFVTNIVDHIALNPTKDKARK